jgi:hypothetical protein
VNIIEQYSDETIQEAKKWFRNLHYALMVPAVIFFFLGMWVVSINSNKEIITYENMAEIQSVFPILFSGTFHKMNAEMLPIYVVYQVLKWLWFFASLYLVYFCRNRLFLKYVPESTGMCIRKEVRIHIARALIAFLGIAFILLTNYLIIQKGISAPDINGGFRAMRYRFYISNTGRLLFMSFSLYAIGAGVLMISQRVAALRFCYRNNREDR